MDDVGKESAEEIYHFLNRMEDLKEEFKGKGKMIYCRREVPVPLKDDSKRVFPPGTYLINLTEEDLKKIEGFVAEWEYHIKSGIRSSSRAMKESAWGMEKIYLFLSMRYKPLIFHREGTNHIAIRYNSSSSIKQEELLKLNEKFLCKFSDDVKKDYERTEYKEGKDMLTGDEIMGLLFKGKLQPYGTINKEEKEEGEWKIEGYYDGEERVDDLVDKIRKRKEYESEETKEIAEQLNQIFHDSGVKQIEEIGELKKSIISYFTNEKAAKLYNLMGIEAEERKNKELWEETEREREFWDIIQKGIKKRDKKREK